MEKGQKPIKNRKICIKCSSFLQYPASYYIVLLIAYKESGPDRGVYDDV